MEFTGLFKLFDYGEKVSPGLTSFIGDSIAENIRGRMTLKKSGKLHDSIGILNSGGRVFLGVYGEAGKYARIQHCGGTIRAKNLPYLHFLVNGQWVKKKEVVIPAQNYAELQAEDFKILENALTVELLRRLQ